MDWQPIDSAPFGQDLRLGVIEGSEVHSLVFPCRRTKDGMVERPDQQTRSGPADSLAAVG
jgi:hypothetical protein